MCGTSIWRENWRIAKIISDLCGDDAGAEVAIRPAELLDAGGLDGCVAWKCIMRAADCPRLCHGAICMNSQFELELIRVRNHYNANIFSIVLLVAFNPNQGERTMKRITVWILPMIAAVGLMSVPFTVLGAGMHVSCASGKILVISTGTSDGKCSVKRKNGAVQKASCVEGGNVKDAVKPRHQGSAEADCGLNAGEGGCVSARGPGTCYVSGVPR